MRRWTIVLSLGAALAIAGPSRALPSLRRPPAELRSEIHEEFESIRAHADWDVTGPATWTFFFSANDRPRLEQAAKDLESKGFTVVDLREIAPATMFMRAEWWLAVSKVTIYNEQTLFAQVEALYDFAQEEGLEGFNGRDVGPPPEPVPVK